ncbi:MBL fold metallo-hydrolase [Mesorhizobium temperatum]|uniref:MBL fold metallo-hydrolase n=1 Tax=Mesorhizobium temperatum TaxID=241416 RepID=A0A271LS13_9HYPH|nr:MBL fold metallo-hydrolase [Mesorhizobium temperatum]PAQ10859.1 MBL fold metallo-hydrolase [Mesorhizobium temperatum]
MRTVHELDPSKIFISRRQFLAATSVLASAPLWSWPAFAATPYRFSQGDFEILVVSDGELTLPASLLAPDAPPEELKALLETTGQGPEQVTAATNPTVIRAGDDIILIDNGSGNKFQPTAGKLVENLKAAGIEPESVTKLVFSHAHPDHIWGTLKDDGILTFPNATYYVNSAEWDFWMDPDILTKMPQEFHEFARGAQRDLAAVKERAVMMKPGDDIVTGIKVLDTAGHTPGHISLEVAGEDGLIIVADAITHQTVFFAHPEWRSGVDAIHDLAAQNKKALLERAATDKTRLLGFHWIYPGVGYAERKDDAYRFVAVT